jgi:hypothetical protein
MGKLLDYFFFKMKSGEPSRITYSIDKADEDIIILGSSRANHHYNANVIEDRLQNTCYNAGVDGQGILYEYSILKCVLTRHKTKTIILDFNVNEFISAEQSYSRLCKLLPYYNKDKEIRPIVNLRSRFENLKALSNLYRYNSSVFTIVINYLITSKEFSSKGYIPLKGNWNKHLGEKITYKETNDFDTCKIAIFKSFIENAQKANCQVFVIVSPYFQKFEKTPESLRIAKRICKQYSIHFEDYSQLPLFLQHQEYFRDIEHLNSTGAELYTKIVSNLLYANKVLRGLNKVEGS